MSPLFPREKVIPDSLQLSGVYIWGISIYICTIFISNSIYTESFSFSTLSINPTFFIHEPGDTHQIIPDGCILNRVDPLGRLLFARTIYDHSRRVNMNLTGSVFYTVVLF